MKASSGLIALNASQRTLGEHPANDAVGHQREEEADDPVGPVVLPNNDHEDLNSKNGDKDVVRNARADHLNNGLPTLRRLDRLRLDPTSTRTAP